jgi:hypothetical protein
VDGWVKEGKSRVNTFSKKPGEKASTLAHLHLQSLDHPERGIEDEQYGGTKPHAIIPGAPCKGIQQGAKLAMAPGFGMTLFQ